MSGVCLLPLGLSACLAVTLPFGSPVWLFKTTKAAQDTPFQRAYAQLALHFVMNHRTPADPSDYVPLVNLISIYFQIRDDYMNLQSSEYADNKGFCEDLTEGKFSFPVVHGVRADQGNRQILSECQTTSRPVCPPRWQ